MKHQGLMGGIPHSALVALAHTVLLWPYLQNPKIWIFIAFLGITHLFQDSYKIKAKKDGFAFYIIDQLMHVAFASCVWFTDLTKLQPPPQSDNFWISLYNNDVAILYVMAFLLVTYNGHWMIVSFKQSYPKALGEYTHFDRWYGMIERLLAVSMFFLGGKYFLLLPILFCARFIVYAIGRNTSAIHKGFISPRTLLFSWTIALVIGAVCFNILQ